MKYLFKNAIAAMFFVSLLMSCEHNISKNGDCIQGLDNVIFETRSMPQFSGISSSIVGNIFLIEGSNYEVRIETNENVLPVIRTEVESGDLVIETFECISQVDRMNIYITSPSISSLSFSGVGNVSNEADIDYGNLNVNMTGVGSISLKGQATEFICNFSGIGDLNAFDLTCEEAELKLSGVGTMRVTVNQRLDAILLGTGDILYKGDPTVTATVSGTGNVRKSN